MSISTRSSSDCRTVPRQPCWCASILPTTKSLQLNPSCTFFCYAVRSHPSPLAMSLASGREILNTPFPSSTSRRFFPARPRHLPGILAKYPLFRWHYIHRSIAQPLPLGNETHDDYALHEFSYIPSGAGPSGKAVAALLERCCWLPWIRFTPSFMLFLFLFQSHGRPGLEDLGRLGALHRTWGGIEGIVCVNTFSNPQTAFLSFCFFLGGRGRGGGGRCSLPASLI